MSKNKCDGCTTCCEHVAIELDKPEDREDIQYLIWYLMHKNIAVFIDNSGDWFIEIKNKCKALGRDGKCKIYSSRPDICREYNTDECEKYGEGDYYKQMFKSREDLLKYIDSKPRLKKLMDKK